MKNLLAEPHKKLFEEGISEEEFHKRQEEFLELYYKLRRKNESLLFERLSVSAKQKIHKVVLFAYIAKNHLGGFSYEIIKNKRTETKRPVIFAVTHIGKFDIELMSEALKDHNYILTGDFEHLQGTIDEIFLALNGIIYFNEDVKSDRQSAADRMIAVLKQGGNLMYFPEGAWNMIPHLPMLPLYWGIIDVARQGNAIIVPVACDQYGKHFKVNIGSNFDVQNYPDGIEGKTKAIGELRDIMATLKYEIWETETMLKRSELTGNEWEQYCEARFKEWPYFNHKHIERLVYRPKGIISPEEAFAFWEKLIPSKANAFLWRGIFSK